MHHGGVWTGCGGGLGGQGSGGGSVALVVQSPGARTETCPSALCVAEGCDCMAPGDCEEQSWLWATIKPHPWDELGTPGIRLQDVQEASLRELDGAGLEKGPGRAVVPAPRPQQMRAT